jgi:hypothetical protein
MSRLARPNWDLGTVRGKCSRVKKGEPKILTSYHPSLVLLASCPTEYRIVGSCYRAGGLNQLARQNLHARHSYPCDNNYLQCGTAYAIRKPIKDESSASVIQQMPGHASVT